MQAIETHICLVSAQPTPNLTPVVDQAVAPKRVILLVSPDMENNADWLEAILKPRGIRVERWLVRDPWDIEHVQDRLMHALERLGDLTGLAVNATGGTKPMSIAAYKICEAYDLPVFYVHPEKDRLIWLRHPDNPPPMDLADRLKIEPFLAAHGVALKTVPRRNVPNQRQLDVAQTMVREMQRFKTVLPKLNHLASKAARNLLSPAVIGKDAVFDELIDLLAANHLLERQGDRLRFADEESRFFANGGWLEEYVFDVVRKLRRTYPSIQDAAFGVEVFKGAVKNELDVVFLNNNRLHIIECKTRKFTKEGEQSPGAEAVYKLDSISDLVGGIQARAMLISYLPLKKSNLNRARHMHIDVCDDQNILRLKEFIKAFIR